MIFIVVEQFSADSCGPPLYGHICCRIVAQPNSVVMPLSEGVLTVSSLDEDRCYEGVRCRLQAGVLSCCSPSSVCNSRNDQPLLNVCFSKNSKILSSRYAKSLIVTSDRHVPNGRHQKHYLLIADSEEDIAAWRHAFSLQISDCERWGEFAICPVKLTSEPRATEPATLSRANGRRLYDEIQINDGQWNEKYTTNTVREACSPYRYLPEPSTYATFTQASSAAFVPQTAPSGRRKTRTPVQSLFQPAADGEPRYVINLPVGDVNTTAPTSNYTAPTSNYTAPTSNYTAPTSNYYYDSTASNPPPSNGDYLDGWRRNPFQHDSTNDYSRESGRFKGIRKSMQRSFGALLNHRKGSVEISRF
ncbi:unnamed protein product [Anisakis simplex]|uniref:PH domain-containing protein n=1 Tax=Anisakis simplex TaxID=6269 RepID=A0A0M3KCJ0_ANISI|nr:unnamed protein product [Anisakis simplex]